MNSQNPLNPSTVRAVLTKQSNRLTNLSDRFAKLQATTSPNPKGRGRNARRRQRRSLLSSTSIPTFSGSANPWSAPSVSDTALRRVRNSPPSLRIKGMTSDGLDFLKCAFAPPDFSVQSVAGVPDDYQGQSLVKKHKLVVSRVLTASVDTYILLLPTPGIAFWVATVPPGTGLTANTIFSGVEYSDFPSMFGASGSSGHSFANQVTKFRYVSNHIEVIPTVNQMSWSGSLEAFKLPIQVSIRQQPENVNTDLWTVTGLNGCNATNSQQYTGPFNNGIFSGCYGTNADFEFTPVLENVMEIPAVIGAGDFGAISAPTSLPGFDNGFDSLVIRFAGIGTNPNDSYILKTWACVEYQVAPGTSIYEYQTLSPVDPVAIAYYKKIILNLPVGVPYTQNDSFWKRVLGIINSISGITSNIPGLFGTFSRGVNLASGALMPMVSE